MKQRAARSKQSSTEHPSESSSAWQSPGQGLLYEEVAGKTVDFIRHSEQSSGWLRSRFGSQTAHSFSLNQSLGFSFVCAISRPAVGTSRPSEIMESPVSNTAEIWAGYASFCAAVVFSPMNKTKTEPPPKE